MSAVSVFVLFAAVSVWGCCCTPWSGRSTTGGRRWTAETPSAPHAETATNDGDGRREGKPAFTTAGTPPGTRRL